MNIDKLNAHSYQVSFNDILFAIVIRSSFKTDGIEFFTPGEFSQQLGYMNRPKGYVIRPHKHQIQTRTVNYTQEVLLIKSGSVRVKFYDDDGFVLGAQILESGDARMIEALGLFPGESLIKLKKILNKITD